MIRLAVDGMGGDNAPEQIVKGTMLALEKFDNIDIVHGTMSNALFGYETYDETDKYIFLHRVKKTNIFGLSDSTDCFIDFENITQNEYIENIFNIIEVKK